MNKSLWPLLIITLVALLCNLNSWGVLEASEARYAEISREMFRTGDWLHPTLLNIYHYHKPPVTFWLTSLGFSLFGVNAFGARFFLQISLIAQAALVYFIARQLFETIGQTTVQSTAATLAKARLAAIIYLSFPLSILSARNLTTDSFLTTFALATIYCMTAYYARQKVWGIYGSAFFIGIGFLTKGPAIFVVPFFFWLYLMFARRLDYRVPIKHLLIALLLCVGLGLSWYVYVAGKVPGLADYFISQQVVARVTDDQAFNRAKPGWYYPLILAVTTLPWGVLYIVSFFSNKYNISKSAETRQLLLYWIALPFAVFALSSSKLMMYLLPLYPGIALVSACLLTNLARPSLVQLAVTFACFYTVLGIVASVALPLVTQLSTTAIKTAWPMYLFSLLLVITPFLIYRLFKNDRLRVGIMAVSSVLILTIYGGYFLGANELLLSGTRPVAQFIQSQGLQDRPMLVYGELLPSLAFNLDQDIITISDDAIGYGVERETQFQEIGQTEGQLSDQWRQFWIYLEQPDSQRYLERLVRSPSVLIIRETILEVLPESRRWVLQNYPQYKTMGPWTMLYQ